MSTRNLAVQVAELPDIEWSTPVAQIAVTNTGWVIVCRPAYVANGVLVTPHTQMLALLSGGGVPRPFLLPVSGVAPSRWRGALLKILLAEFHRAGEL